MPEFATLDAVRLVSTSAAIDAALSSGALADDTIVLRTAPDEALIIGARADTIDVDDPHAIVVDDRGWKGAWLSADDTAALLRSEAAWQPPTERPSLAQGMIAHLPVKLWLEADRTLLIVPHVSAADLTHRIDIVLHGHGVSA